MAFWNRLSYRIKSYVVLGGLLLLGFLIYSIKIKPTIAQYQHLQELRSIGSDEEIDNEMNLLESEMVYLDRILGKDRKSLELINNELVEYISLHEDSTNCELVNMPNAHFVAQQGYKVYTHKAVVRGSLQDLLPLAYYLETKTSGMKLASARYFTSRNQRTRRDELFVELYVQSYEKN